MHYLTQFPKMAALAGFLLAALTAHAGKEGWSHNYDEALAKAKAEGKVLMVEFHGSDWCPPCKKLNSEVLSTDAFKALADKSLVLVDVDFPRKSELPAELKAHNEALAEKYGIEGLPTVLLIDGDGKVLDKMVGYPRGGLEGFLKFINDQIK